MRFVQIDTQLLYDLEVKNTSFYDVNRGDYGEMDEPEADGNGEEVNVFKGVIANGLAGSFGNVNLQQGMRSDFELCFYFTGTEDPAQQDLFYFSFFDLDQGTTSSMTAVYREKLYMTDPNHFYINVDGVSLIDNPDVVGTQCEIAEVNQVGGAMFQVGTLLDGAEDFFPGNDWVASEVKTAVCANDDGSEGGGDADSFFSNYPCTDLVVTRDGADVTAQSSSKGFGCDNPDDPADQTDVQTARSIMFEFEDITCMEVGFESQGDVKTSSGRNFLFAGAAFECECT